MEWILDTADIKQIQSCIDTYPISGVTTNPSIIKKEGMIDLFEHFKTIRSIIQTRSLHIQVISQDTQGILNEAQKIHQMIDKDVYIKVPTTKAGLKAMRILKEQGYLVTATAIYTRLQAALAIELQVDYLAPYVNRMANLDMDPFENLAFMAQVIAQSGSSSKIVAASFKNLHQVIQAIESGVHAVTIDPSLLEQILEYPSIQEAVNVFQADFESLYGKGKTIYDV
jgi:transaldolase